MTDSSATPNPAPNANANVTAGEQWGLCDCPFCGGEPVQGVIESDGEPTYYYVCCGSDDCIASMLWEKFYPSVDEVAAAWNKRPPLKDHSDFWGERKVTCTGAPSWWVAGTNPADLPASANREDFAFTASVKYDDGTEVISGTYRSPAKPSQP